MLQVFSFYNCSIFKENDTTPVAQLQYIFFPCARAKLHLLSCYRDTGRTSSSILQVYVRYFTLFQRFLISLILTLCCTAPIYLISMCKRRIKFVEGLPRHMPYKLMHIASLYQKFDFFSKISPLFLNFQEKSKLTPCCTIPKYILSMCKKKIKSVEGLRRNRP